MPIRFLKRRAANPLDPAWVQPDKRGWMVSNGAAKRSLTVIEDDQEQWRCPPTKPRLPNGAQSCRCRRCGAFGDRNFKRVRAITKGKTDWLEVVPFW
jgi:hypothetical protein